MDKTIMAHELAFLNEELGVLVGLQAKFAEVGSTEYVVAPVRLIDSLHFLAGAAQGCASETGAAMLPFASSSELASRVGEIKSYALSVSVLLRMIETRKTFLENRIRAVKADMAWADGIEDDIAMLDVGEGVGIDPVDLV